MQPSVQSTAGWSMLNLEYETEPLDEMEGVLELLYGGRAKKTSASEAQVSARGTLRSVGSRPAESGQCEAGGAIVRTAEASASRADPTMRRAELRLGDVERARLLHALTWRLLAEVRIDPYVVGRRSGGP